MQEKLFPNALKEAEVVGAEIFLRALASAEEKGTLYNATDFPQALSLSFRLIATTQAELVQNGLGIAASVSRWANGKACPSQKTQRRVVSYLREKAGTLLQESPH